jgi:hypothetical protein
MARSKVIAAAVLSILLVAVLLGVWAWPKRTPAVVSRPAPDPVAPQAAAVRSAQETLTNDVIMTMIQEKVPFDLILDQIHSAKLTSFDLSTPELIRLNKAGVPRAIIDQMRHPSAELAVQTAGSTATESATSTLPAPRATGVTLTDGTPFQITLTDAIPDDANLGLPLRFTVSDDLKVQGIVVLPKGALVYGEITETPKRKFLGIGSGKLSFSLSKAQLPDGSWVKVRSLASARADGGTTQRPVEAPSAKGAKDIAAPPGTAYIAYIDSEQQATVPVK